MTSSMSYKSAKLKVWIIVVIGLALLFYVMPLFKVVSLKEAQQKALAANFDPVTYVGEIWQGALLEAAENAVDVVTLHQAFQQDAQQAANDYGNRLGLSGTASYFVSGQGYIVSAEADSVSIALMPDGKEIAVIEIGPIFGNAIRDGSGLFNISDFSNTQDYNALSEELNRRVEQQVLPILQADNLVGKQVRFAGGVDISDYDGVPDSFLVVPVVVEVL